MRRALSVTWVATAIAIILASGHGLVRLIEGRVGAALASYEPSLAVLTATLIAVIWYTYFTFRAVIARPRTEVVAGVRFAAERGVIEFRAENHSSSWTVARVTFRLWFDSVGQELPEVLRGGDSLRLGPWESCAFEAPHAVDLREEGGVFEVLIEGKVEWEDEVGSGGQDGPRYWRIDVRGKRECESVYGTTRIEGLLAAVSDCS